MSNMSVIGSTVVLLQPSKFESQLWLVVKTDFVVLVRELALFDESFTLTGQGFFPTMQNIDRWSVFPAIDPLKLSSDWLGFIKHNFFCGHWMRKLYRNKTLVQIVCEEHGPWEGRSQTPGVTTVTLLYGASYWQILAEIISSWWPAASVTNEKSKGINSNRCLITAWFLRR